MFYLILDSLKLYFKVFFMFHKGLREMIIFVDVSENNVST